MISNFPTPLSSSISVFIGVVVGGNPFISLLILLSRWPRGVDSSIDDNFHDIRRGGALESRMFLAV